MDNTILTLLNQVGFNEKEATVYTALLELGQGDITDIAKKTGLKRSIIYVVLEKLQTDGYVNLVPQLKVKTYTASDPKKIMHNLQTKAVAFRDMLPIISALYSMPGKKPRIQYFEGKSAVLSVYREVSRFPEVFFISSIQQLRKYIPEEVDLWVKSFQSKNNTLHGWHLMPRTSSDVAFGKAVTPYGQRVRFLPKGYEIDMDFSLYGNKVAITAIGDPFFVVVIESQIIFNSMRVIFDLLWKQAKPL
ncbi:MAG TPA: helix-turn-helix domain-containing protein [Patescibacteria group bacterium]|nr:helix-turn-helix domain-containing protein [Patescibacteria group bacterium]